MKFSINMSMLRKDIKTQVHRYEAIERTMKDSGVGEVLVSRRKKMPKEKKKPLHGKAIANFMMKHGKDPFALDKREEAKIENFIAEGLTKAISTAAKTAKSQEKEAKDVLLKAAELYAAAVRKHIGSGGLGQSTGKYKKFKIRMVKAGFATAEYGTPPPTGILSGRYIKGIRHRWRLGRRKL